MKAVFIAEKPSVAAEFAKALKLKTVSYTHLSYLEALVSALVAVVAASVEASLVSP